MEDKKEVSVSDIYKGGYSSLNPETASTYTGYSIPAGNIGAPAKPDTANQIQHVTQLLNQGIVPIEVGTLSPDVFEQIPDEQLKEINRLSKLTNAKVSVHAPMIEPSGIAEKGGWSESDQKLAERRLQSVFERSRQLDPKGHVPITIHASNIPGMELEKIGKGKPQTKQMIAINQETGELTPLRRERKFYPIPYDEKEKEPIPLTLDAEGEIYTPERELEALNHTKWDNAVSSAIFQKDKADQIIETHYPLVKDVYPDIIQGGEKLKDAFKGPYRDVIARVQTAHEHLKETAMQMRALFNKAFQYSSEEERRKLIKLSEQYKKDLGYFDKKKSEEERLQAQLDLERQSKALQKMLEGLKQVQPKLYVPVEKFAVEKSAETFSNVVFDSFKKNPDSAPKLSIENFHPGSAFAYGKQLNELVLKTKEKFIEKAKKQGFSEELAAKKADELIQVTLDIGHLNMARKHGFETEDIIKEAEAIAKHVGHVHITDNFGFYDSHLPPGMGNVPTKEILEKLEKAGFKGRTIVEAGGWVQHMGTSPHPFALEGLGAPLYADKPSPYWTEAMRMNGDYYGGYGLMLPQTNYEMFGAGFASLPAELGGSRNGANGSRMSGRPME